MNKILHSPEKLMTAVTNVVHPQLGATFALVSFLHVVIGAYLGVYYQHQLNSGFDNFVLKLVEVLYAIKDAF